MPTWSSPGSATPSPPAPGELGIKERRSWRTWQLAAGMLVAIVVGMAIGHSGASSSASTAGAQTPGYTLPPASASSTTTQPGSARNGGTGQTTTTRPSSAAAETGPSTSSTTTSRSTSGDASTVTTTVPTAAGTVTPTKVLVSRLQSTGDGATPAFDVTGAGWDIGWSYDCEDTPGGTGAFQVFVVPANGSVPATPATSQVGRSSSGVTGQTSTGTQSLAVKATTGCIWVVRVTS